MNFKIAKPINLTDSLNIEYSANQIYPIIKNNDIPKGNEKI
jgi:hypothetical protein